MKEFLGLLYIFGEAITVYTLIACTSMNTPFPVWFRGAWNFYLVTMSIVIIGVLAVLAWTIAREIRRRVYRSRRKGMVRYDVGRGCWYTTGGR